MIAPAAGRESCAVRDLGLLTQCPCKHMQPETLLVTALKLIIKQVLPPNVLYKCIIKMALMLNAISAKRGKGKRMKEN